MATLEGSSMKIRIRDIGSILSQNWIAWLGTLTGVLLLLEGLLVTDYEPMLRLAGVLAGCLLLGFGLADILPEQDRQTRAVMRKVGVFVAFILIAAFSSHLWGKPWSPVQVTVLGVIISSVVATFGLNFFLKRLHR